MQIDYMNRVEETEEDTLEVSFLNKCTMNLHIPTISIIQTMHYCENEQNKTLEPIKANVKISQIYSIKNVIFWMPKFNKPGSV